jgi:hypothetical protein
MKTIINYQIADSISFIADWFYKIDLHATVWESSPTRVDSLATRIRNDGFKSCFVVTLDEVVNFILSKNLLNYTISEIYTLWLLETQK